MANPGMQPERKEFEGFKHIGRWKPLKGQWYLTRRGRLEQASFDHKLDSFPVYARVDAYGQQIKEEGALVGDSARAPTTQQPLSPQDNNKEWHKVLSGFVAQFYTSVPGLMNLKVARTPEELEGCLSLFISLWSEYTADMMEVLCQRVNDPHAGVVAAEMRKLFTVEFCGQKLSEVEAVVEKGAGQGGGVAVSTVGPGPTPPPVSVPPTPTPPPMPVQPPPIPPDLG